MPPLPHEHPHSAPDTRAHGHRDDGQPHGHVDPAVAARAGTGPRGHHHDHSASRHLPLALALTLGFAAVEAVAGWWSGSLALLGDAGHMVTDALALGLAALATLIGCNYFASLYYTTTGSAEHSKGRATGIHEATLAFGLAAGSIIGGVAGTWFSPRAPFWLAAAVVAALIVPQLVVHARLIRSLNLPAEAGG